MVGVMIVDTDDPEEIVELLKDQRDRIKEARRAVFMREQAILEAERLRKEILCLGEEPCA